MDLLRLEPKRMCHDLLSKRNMEGSLRMEGAALSVVGEESSE